MLMELVKPYGQDLFTFNKQLLSSLTICRHGLPLKFMAFIMDTSETSVHLQWLDNFLATVFNRLDVIPVDGYLLHKMPNAFIIQ